MEVYVEGSVNETKKDTSKKDGEVTIVDENSEKILQNESDVHDNLKMTKSLVIRKAELMAKQYDTWTLRVVFLFSAFLCSFGYGLDSNIRDIYMTYAMNSYSTHSLVSTVDIISEVISAVAQLFFAGLSDVFGRLSLFIVSIIFYAVGTIIQSQAYDVQRYAAGTFFYNVGLVGAMLQVVLILSDNSSLKWRLLYTFVPAWPSIITTWVSGNVVSAANPEKNWSWSIGMWAFIFPLSCLPLIGCMLHMRWKVRNDPEWKELQNENSYYKSHGFVQMLVQLFWKLDVIGVMLLAVSVGCICVPLTLAGGVSSTWRNPKIIAPLVLGVVLFPIFVFWESKIALVPMAPFKLLKDRGIWAPLCIMFLVCFVYAMAADYLYTILLVAVNQTDLSATRIMNLYAFVTAIFSPFLSILVARSSRLKPYIVLGGALYFVTMGLFFHYRSGKDSDKGIIGGMVVWGFCSGLFDYPINVSIQTVTSHENMASVTALGYTIFSIGGAVASAISGAIWTQLLYPKLYSLMGDATLAEAAYESPLDFIDEYAWGTPIRDAMVEAYRYVQKYEVLVALVFTAPMFILSFFIRDPQLTEDVAQKLEKEEYVETTQRDPISDWFADRFPRLSRRE
ncbi:probable Siderophore iron transporter ARN2 [Zygosaccharomyces bailii]|uniref:ZYBA0S10-00144g1_1 n=1 Tax=Zygosaccharomyces bailii (strain CLIB 213 / ATCC 58445 / CBS 680 / BCRC 21525 / NBRC 1098 / NCYC 1416 / NRRL Y-2227) TaxID=1333698 RepID=A0A8J2T9Z6_ZYGB2|nr:ZYBA0S10-00144g1_1 [Zygosaccharomyces bailii CLIB 213]SJM87946.1 probable Siderophore iron transporter ARN2 [Zygosaccharomyces bailii]